MPHEGATRRDFLKRTATGSAVLALGAPRSIAAELEPITFGLCADVHQDVMHDATERMAVFVRAMNERNATFVAQLGDFCIPKKANQRFLDTFRSFEGPHYHVLGNHDTDSDNLTNYYKELGSIPYVQVNSMSYFWVGEECQNFAYPPHIHAANPMLEFTAPYRDPLWTMVTVDPDAGEIRIEGRTSVWAGASPEELGYQSPPSRRRGMSPRVDERILDFTTPA